MPYVSDIMMGAVGGGAAAGAYYGDTNRPFDENARRGSIGGLGLFTAASTMAGLGYVAHKTRLDRAAWYAARKTAGFAVPAAAKGTAWTGKNIAGWLGGAAKDYVSGMKIDYGLFKNAALRAGATEGLASFKASRAFFRPMGMGLAGAAIGTMVSDDAETGALVGGGLGTAAGAVIRYAPQLKTISKMPGIGKLGLLATTVGAAAIGAAMAPPQYQSAAAAVEDGAGDIEYSEYTGGVQTRMRNIAASGDVVLGAHRRRHG